MPRRKSPKPSSSSRKSRSRTRSRHTGRQRKGSSSNSSEPRGTRRRVSKSKLCNLDFPVARVKTMLKVNNHGLRVSDKTAVFTTAVLEYMTHEILELSLNATREHGRSRIQPTHVNMAIKMDPELFRNFKNSSVRDSNFIPLDQMINGQRTTPHRTQDTSLPGLSNAVVERPVSSRKSGSRGITRREG